MSWREGFHQAVGEWLDRSLPETRPYDDYGRFAEIVDITEELDLGFGGSDVTAPDDPVVDLTIVWRNTVGEQHAVSFEMTLTELMKELT